MPASVLDGIERIFGARIAPAEILLPEDNRGEYEEVPDHVRKGIAIYFVSRFEQGRGTNPEELVAAAHASCFSMALSAGLSQAGTPPEEIRTRATVTLRMAAEGPKVVAVHLDVTGRVPGIDTDAFQEAADGAKSNCPISRLLAPGLESLSMEARLEG